MSGALINVSAIVSDPAFAQVFNILRSTGSWLNGVWQSATVSVPSYGVIANPSVRELEMIPEGDRVKGAIVVWTVAEIFTTHATEGAGGSSDIVQWRGHNYRVLEAKVWADFGYYRAIAVRMKAD